MTRTNLNLKLTDQEFVMLHALLNRVKGILYGNYKDVQDIETYRHNISEKHRTALKVNFEVVPEKEKMNWEFYLNEEKDSLHYLNRVNDVGVISLIDYYKNK